MTHGEPHLGNLILGDDGYLLVDWDTVGLAVPERDLSVLSDSPLALARYAEVTGRTPDAAALALYRLRWSLVDVAEFITWFRGPHSRTSDTEAAWQGFTGTLDHLRAPLKAKA
ncbi:MAG: phosphotransferase family protein [Pseudonocardiaceae bacterium]